VADGKFPFVTINSKPSGKGRRLALTVFHGGGFLKKKIRPVKGKTISQENKTRRRIFSWGELLGD